MRAFGCKALTTLAALLLLASFAAGACTFLTVDADPSAQVILPATASFAVRISNTGPSEQAIAVSSLCDSSRFVCSFPDEVHPFLLSSGQASTVHLNVDTSKASPGNYSLELDVQGGTAGSCTEARTVKLIALANLSNTTAPAPIASALLVPNATLTAFPGDTVHYTVLVSNPTTESVVVNIRAGSLEGNPFSSTTGINPVQYTLASQESKASDVSLTVPAGWPGGLQQFTILVSIVKADGTISYITLPVTLFVYSPRLFLQLASSPDSSSCTYAFASNTTTAEFDVRNLGDITGPFVAQLSVPSAISGAVSSSLTQFTLNQGEATGEEVSISPTTATPTGTYSYSLQVTYLNLPAITYTGCITILPLYGINAIAAQEYRVLRGAQTVLIPLQLTNNGSVSQNYSIEFNPRPGQGVFLSADPLRFTLVPQQTQVVTLSVQADSSATLGPLIVPLTIRSSNVTQAVQLHLFIASSNLTGSSPLFFTLPPAVDVFEGIPQQASVKVTNNGRKPLAQVEVFAEGIPASWVVIRTPPQDIPAGATKTYVLTFTIPANTNQPGPRVFTLTAVSGLESVRAPLLIHVIKPIPAIAYRVEGFTQVNSGGTASEVHMRLTVTNAGNVPATQVTATIPYATGYVVAADPVNLAPGQSSFMDVTITPTANVGQQDVFLTLSSLEGATRTDSVKLPALSPATPQVDLWPRALAIVLLLVAIAALLKREDIERQLSGNR